MRGEETQIAGFIAAHPEWDGILCLPGTHSKWAHISAGEVVSFRTFLTGEMFAPLSRQSVLRHSVGGDGWDDAAFVTAVSDTLSRPEHLASSLFSLRAGSLLDDLPAATARAQLGHMNVSLIRTDEDIFEIMVMRSMTHTAIHELTRAMKALA